MRAQVFQDAVSSSTRVFGRSDVRVVFRGDGACTDGKTVFLPALPPSAEINVDQAAVIRGYRDHEAMHVRITDTSSDGLGLVVDARNTSPLAESLLQYAEDVRIEHAGVLEYPGMALNLTAVNTEAGRVLIEGAEKIGPAETVFTQCGRDLKLKVCISTIGRKLIGVENGGVLDGIVEIIKRTDPEIYEFGKRCAERLAALPTGYRNGRLVESTAKKGTFEAAKVAREIYDEFMAKYQEKQPEQPQQPDQPDGDQQDDQPNGGNQDSNPGLTLPKKQDDDTQDSDPSDQPGDTQDDSQPGNQPQPDDQPDDSDQDGGGGGGDQQPDNQPDDDDDQQGGGSGGGDLDDDQDDDQPSSGRRTDDGGKGNLDDIKEVKAGGGGSAQMMLDTSALDVGDYSKALEKTVKDIGQKSSGSASLSRSFYKPWTNEFNVKLPLEEILYHRPVSGLKDKEIVSYFNDIMDRGVRTYFGEMLNEISGKRAMIRRLLELELQARDDRRWEAGHTRGRLHSVRLVDAINGKQNVYQNRHDGKDMNTALVISIDASGSMNSQNRMHNAMLLALALTEALERTGCEIEVVIWGNAVNKKYGVTSGNVDEVFAPLSHVISGGDHGYTGNGIIHRGVVKGLRERLSSPDVQGRFYLATHGMRCGTPFFDAVFNDLHDMAKLPHRKKIYMNITDGDSDAILKNSTVYEHDLIREYQALAERNNIHLVGVGIAGKTVNHLFKDCINVSGADAYEPAIKLLSKIIAKEVGHGTFRRAA